MRKGTLLLSVLGLSLGLTQQVMATSLMEAYEQAKISDPVVKKAYFSPHSYFATFAVNFLGCFLIGFLAEVDFKTAMYVKYFLIAGLLGGFTTFSAFGLESLAMLKAASHLKAFYYVSGTVILCLVSVYLGALTYKLLN